jgi:hypothetical protein
MTNTACLNRQELMAYLMGKVSDPVWESVAAHIDNCPQCQTELGTLDDVDDTLVSFLRSPAGKEGLKDASKCQNTPPGRTDLKQTKGPGVEGLSPGSTETGRLGEYELLSKLGQGGMGIVYLARHTILQRMVALKVLLPSRLEDVQAVGRFFQEMKVVGGLNHANIVHAYDARWIEEKPVLVMEYIHGFDLGKLVRLLGPLSVADACEMVRQTAIGLQYIHEHGLVHRDIKPTNLMLTPEGGIKILDLGLTKLGDVLPAEEEITRTGQPLGTPEYMAPEQFSDSHQVDIRADIYSLGCTLYKLLTGRIPFKALRHRCVFPERNAPERGSTPSLSPFCPDAPAELDGLLNRMLAENPADRMATPAEAANALERWSQGSGLRRLTAQAEALSAAPAPTAGPSQDLTGRLTSPASPLGATGVETPMAPRPRRLKIGPRTTVAAGVLGLAFVIAALGLIIRFGKSSGPQTELEVPEGSKIAIDEHGVKVTLPDRTPGLRNHIGNISAPGIADQVPSLLGWRSQRCDLGKTSFYGRASQRRTGNAWKPFAWKAAAPAEFLSSVLTGDVNGDGRLEVVTVEGNTVAVYDAWGKELWRRNPIGDSGVHVPPGRIDCVSRPVLEDFDKDGVPEVLLMAGSYAEGGWNTKAPVSVVVYDGRGNVARKFNVIDGGVGGPEPCFDFNGDGRLDVVLTVSAYRHPHALCIYDYSSGEMLWQTDFADGPTLAGVGVTGRKEADLFAIVGFDCHVDPPVGDYDSDHCYAVLFNAQGRRLWKREYQHSLDGSMADLDGDGKADLVLINTTEEGARLLLLNPKDGTPTATLDGLGPATHRAWSIADVNGDGRKEIVLGDGKQLYVIDYRARALIRCEAAHARVLATNDLNGDGAVEILAAEGSDLVVFNGRLREIGRYRAEGTIQSAFVSDLDGDGINEALLRTGKGKKIRLEIVHPEPEPAPAAVDRAKPGKVAWAFITAWRKGKPEASAAFVLPSERDRLLAVIRGKAIPEIPPASKLEILTHIDDAETLLPGTPPIRLRLRFVEGQWWVREVSIE